MVDETLNKLDCTRSRNLIFERLSLWYRNYKRSAHRIENRVSTRDFCILNSPRRHVTTTNTASPCRKWNNYVVVRGLQRARYGRQWALRIEGRRSDYGLTALHAESLLSVIPSRGEREWERKREREKGEESAVDTMVLHLQRQHLLHPFPFHFVSLERAAARIPASVLNVCSRYWKSFIVFIMGGSLCV